MAIDKIYSDAYFREYVQHEKDPNLDNEMMEVLDDLLNDGLVSPLENDKNKMNNIISGDMMYQKMLNEISNSVPVDNSNTNPGLTGIIEHMKKTEGVLIFATALNDKDSQYLEQLVETLIENDIYVENIVGKNDKGQELSSLDGIKDYFTYEEENLNEDLSDTRNRQESIIANSSVEEDEKRETIPDHMMSTPTGYENDSNPLDTLESNPTPPTEPTIMSREEVDVNITINTKPTIMSREEANVNITMNNDSQGEKSGASLFERMVQWVMSFFKTDHPQPSIGGDTGFHITDETGFQDYVTSDQLAGLGTNNSFSFNQTEGFQFTDSLVLSENHQEEETQESQSGFKPGGV